MSEQPPPSDMPAEYEDNNMEAPEDGEGIGREDSEGAQWYYALGGQSFGPVTESDLKALARQGAFGVHDYVYARFLDDWVRADSVYGLFDEEEGGEPSVEAGAPPLVPMPGAGSPEALTYQTQYAGFWIRAGAVIIDWCIIYIPKCLVTWMVTLPLMFLFGRLSSGASGGNAAAEVASVILMYAAQYGVHIAVHWLYFGLMESSRWQATLGKRAVGIIVTDMEGRRLSFGHASGRYFASIVSGLTFGVGYIMGAFTQRRQTLHDIMAKTLVVYGRQRRAGSPA